MIYGEYAPTYFDLGYIPLPIGMTGNGKHPIDRQYKLYQDRQFRKPMSREEMMGLCRQYPDENIGIMTGSRIQDWFIVAIDIDEDDLVDPIREVMGDCVCAKFGGKGQTIFARSFKKFQTKILFRRGAMKQSVELFGMYNQVVIPPSIYKATGNNYIWIGWALCDIDVSDLPEITQEKITNIRDLVV